MVAPLAISSPEGCQTDMVAVPNPVIASVQIIDPGYDVTRVEIVGSGVVHQGRTMGYGRCKIVDADNPDRVIAFNEGQGAIIGIPPEGLDKMDVSGTELVVEDSPDLPPLWAAFGAAKRDDGHWVLPALSARTRLARCGVAHRTATRRARDRGHRPCRRHRRDQEGAGRQLARHVHVARQGGPFPGGGHCARRADPDASACACCCTTRATRTRPSPPPRRSSRSSADPRCRYAEGSLRWRGLASTRWHC